MTASEPGSMSALISMNISVHEIPDTSPALSLSDVMVSDTVFRIFQWTIYAVGCLMVAVFGAVANIINIISFAKQGLKESVNVNFLGLAISDMGCLTTQLIMSIGHNPHFQALDLPFDVTEVVYITAGWPHIFFSRVTSWITAFITMERCLCITMPLKVKSVITPQRSTIFIIGINIIVFFGVAPIFDANRLGWTFSSQRNRTIIGLQFAGNREIIDAICSTWNNIIIPLLSFLIIIVCTIVLVITLRKKTHWREKSTGKTQAQDTSKRDQTVAKMVVAISTIFIMCYIPVCVTVLAMTFVPGLSIDGENVYMAIILAGIGLFLESVNSAMNIFIYYYMSSKYRAVFKQMFRLV